jgi:hypothetical protein
MSPDVAPPDEPTYDEPTGVVIVKLDDVVDVWRDPAASQRGKGYSLASFAAGDKTYTVLVRRGSFEAGERAVFAPNGSVFPDEPEFSSLGSARRRLRAHTFSGCKSDGLLISLDDCAYVMSRRAVRLAETDEEVGRLISLDDGPEYLEYLFDAARAALLEVPIGADVGLGLGIFPYVEDGCE